jgi:PucR C-terminal helix-turn-helix domain/GGDEF-like domain
MCIVGQRQAMSLQPTARDRAELHERLLARRDEIERALFAQISAVWAPAEARDPQYFNGLRRASEITFEHCLGTLDPDEEGGGGLSVALLMQARSAARSGVGLDTVLRRCVAGHALFTEFLVAEAATAISAEDLRSLMGEQAVHLDRLLLAIAEEHTRACDGRLHPAQRRAAECVELLLAGKRADTSELAYGFEGHHLALIAKGIGAAETVLELARGRDCRLLLTHRDGGVVWAWLGSQRPVEPFKAEAHDANRPASVSIAVGEPGQGLAGWRLSHEQARAALSLALRRPATLVRYRDVALLASVLRDEVLSSSLRSLYLAPLERDRDGGKTARRTLRAYFAADRNASSAAAALGVTRHTVMNRLHGIEERLGRSLSACAGSLESALSLYDLDNEIDIKDAS